MKKGPKKRLQELEDRNAAAEAIGHAVLDCLKATQTRSVDFVLRELYVQHSRSDLLLAMANRGIAPTPGFRAEFDREVQADRERRERQAESARVAREELTEFRFWKAEKLRRQSANGASAITPIATPLEQAPVRRDKQHDNAPTSRSPHYNLDGDQFPTNKDDGS